MLYFKQDKLQRVDVNRSLLYYLNHSAMRVITVTWVVKAFVDATACSLPAFRYTPVCICMCVCVCVCVRD